MLRVEYVVVIAHAQRKHEQKKEKKGKMGERKER